MKSNLVTRLKKYSQVARNKNNHQSANNTSFTWNYMSLEKPKSISMLLKKSYIIELDCNGFFLWRRLSIRTFLITADFLFFLHFTVCFLNIRC